MADEQVGNNSYLTMTPGSAVAGQLQNILTQKRLEARQAMLDQIHSKDVESQIRDRDENTRANSEFRAANAENRKAQEVQRRAGLYSPDMPMDPNSEDYKYIQKEAPSLINPATPETPQFEYEGQAPIPASGPTFRGLPVQIEASRKAKIQSDAMAALNSPDFAKKSPTERAAIFRMATGSEPSADIIEGRKEPHSQIYTEYQDYLSSKPATPLSFDAYMTMDANRKKVNPPVEHGTFLDRPVIVNGVVDPHKAYVIKNGHITIQAAPDGAEIGSKPNTKIPMVTTQDNSQYAKLRGLATKEPDGFIFNAAGVKVKNSVAFQQFEQGLYGKFPPEVSEAVKAAVAANLPPTTSNEDLVKQALEQGAITRDEVQSFYSLLQTVR